MKTTHVDTSTLLELRTVHGPYTLECQGVTIQLKDKQDAVCLVLVTLCGTHVMSETIVAVTTDMKAFMRLRAFAIADGAITLHPDLG